MCLYLLQKARFFELRTTLKMRLLSQKLSLAICALFLFATFIMVIVAIAGSTANYKPLTNIYIGTADIGQINVTKVIPPFAPILKILGGALNSDNTSIESVFPVLHQLDSTPAFTPLLTLLANAEDTNVTVTSLSELAPLALNNDTNSSTSQQMAEVYQLLQMSSNATESMVGLQSLVAASMEDPTSNSSTIVMSLLADSNDTLASTEALMTLNNMSASEKQQLAPVFTLFQYSSNETATVGSLATLMSSNISSTLTTELFSALNRSTNLNETLQQLESMVPDDSKPAFNAVVTLIETSSSPNVTLTSLGTLLQNNVTSSASARQAFVSLTTLLMNSRNDTLVLQSVQSLAMITNTTTSTQQLTSLQQLLESSTNSTGTLQVLGMLQTGLASDNSTAQYIPPLVSLMEASKDPLTSFTSLMTFNAWAQQNTATFLPVAAILQHAETNPPPTEENIKELTPKILEYFNINSKYQLSIFTLCERDVNNNIKTCSKSHAVQDLDFRSIIWDDLADSDFTPYLNALNVTKDSLHLEGKLLRRQHEYVPAVSATLAFSLLSIILAFFLMLIIIFLMIRTAYNKWVWFAVIVTCLLYTLFTCLAAIIVTAIIGVIKSGTADDDYGVVFKSGTPFLGLLWTSFALALICPILLLVAWIRTRASRNREEQAIVATNKTHDAVNSTDSVSSSINNPNEMHDVEKSHSDPVVVA